jgi:hypothetical protein
MTSRAFKLACATVLVACGRGESQAPPGSGPTSALVSECPSSEPSPVTPCATVGLSCEYDYDQDITCSAFAYCDVERYWRGEGALAGTTCPSPGPGAEGCPSNYADVSAGQPCAIPATACAYSQGLCSCAIEFDASVSWECEAPGPGCPEPRPKLGTACTPEGLACTYGTCRSGDSAQLVCLNGSWSIVVPSEATACP